MSIYARRVERLEAADSDSSLLILTGESREDTIARYEAEHGPILKHRPMIFLSETDARL